MCYFRICLLGKMKTWWWRKCHPDTRGPDLSGAFSWNKIGMVGVFGLGQTGFASYRDIAVKYARSHVSGFVAT